MHASVSKPSVVKPSCLKPVVNAVFYVYMRTVVCF